MTVASATPDELHVSLAVPTHSAKAIYRWARDQRWPEGTKLEKPADYHCTLLYSESGSEWRENPWWIEHMDIGKAKIKSVESFGPGSQGYAYVLTLDAPEIQEHGQKMTDTAGRMGLAITHPEFKPHITVGYGPAKAEGIQPPGFELHLGPSSISDPRPVEEHTAHAAPEPPNFRRGTSAQHCGNCSMFSAGKCWGYGNKTVDSNDVCDSWEKETKLSSLTEVADILHSQCQRGASVQELTVEAARLMRRIGYTPDDMNTQAAIQTWLSLHEGDAQRIAAYGDDASVGAAQSMGSHPEDEFVSGPTLMNQLNPHRGVNPSWLGTSGPHQVMIKPELPQGYNAHPNSVRAERGAFLLGRQMGLNVPAVGVQKVYPPIRNFDSSTWGSVHRWIPNSQTLADHYDDAFPHEQFQKDHPDYARKLFIFDHAMGNYDRSPANILADQEGNFYPIDHGAGFRSEEQYYDPSFNEFHQQLAGQPLTDEDHQQIQAGIQHMSTPEFQNIVSPVEAQHGINRLTALQNQGTF